MPTLMGCLLTTPVIVTVAMPPGLERLKVVRLPDIATFNGSEIQLHAMSLGRWPRLIR